MLGRIRAAERKVRFRSLVICRPFLPEPVSRGMPCSYYFAAPDRLDCLSIGAVAAHSSRVYIEEEIARKFEAETGALPPGARVIKPISNPDSDAEARPRILFLVWNDTHVQFLTPVARHFSDVLFVIPDRGEVDEQASLRLDEDGYDFVELASAAQSHAAIEKFDPSMMLCANDWSPIFHAARNVMKGHRAPLAALQEGPQEWNMLMGGHSANKYRNADVLFAQGETTLRYIDPKYFAITGIPKIDRIEEAPPPEKPRVFINCNFTYGRYEEHRERWMDDVLWAAKDLGLDYIISKHPRDNYTTDDPNLRPSNPYLVRKQLAECSVVVSRFSNILSEALVVRRPAIYYNPHREPMRTLSDDDTGAIQKAGTRAELRERLAAHKENPALDWDAAQECLARHCGPMDGRSLERVVEQMRAILGARFMGESILRGAGLPSGRGPISRATKGLQRLLR